MELPSTVSIQASGAHVTYERPQIKLLGTVAQLTRGAALGNSDNRNFGSAG